MAVANIKDFIGPRNPKKNDGHVRNPDGTISQPGEEYDLGGYNRRTSVMATKTRKPKPDFEIK